MRLGDWELKTVATLGLLLLALPVFSQEPNLSINLSLTVIEGEHSRDSNSTTTTITIKGNHLVYARSYSGYRGKQRQPIHKETVIKNEDMKKLRELISSRKFFDSASFVRPTDSPGSYSIITLKGSLDKKRSSVKISGMTKEIENETLYQDVRALRQEIERIVGAS